MLTESIFTFIFASVIPVQFVPVGSERKHFRNVEILVGVHELLVFLYLINESKI